MMSTLGELVMRDEALTPLRKTQYARSCGRMDIANVLHHLGIWDAEVLELRAGYGDCGEHIWYADDGGDYSIPCEWSSHGRVRILVLPREA